MKHNNYIIVVFILLSTFANAQFKYQKKLQNSNNGFHITSGAEVISFGGNTIIGTYITPQYRFNITPKFHITAGLNIGNLNSNISHTQTNVLFYSTNHLFSNYLFVEGDYSYSDKLKIRGSFYSALQQKPASLPETSVNPLVDNWKNAKIGFDYKLTDGVFINAEIGVSNSPFNSYIYSPFQNNRLY